MPNNKIGARKNGNFKAVSTAPSFNKTPVGASTPPLPYPTTQDLGNSVGVVPTVKFNGDPAYVLNQTTQPSCKGDNPGVAKGVKSGTVNGEVKPVKGSSSVRVGGKPIIRDGDPCTMNGGNNPGIYITTQAPSGAAPKSAAQTSNPPIQAAIPAEKSFLEKAAQDYKNNISPALHEFAGDALDTGGTIAAAGGGTAAVGGVMVATGVGAAPGAVAVVGGGAIATVGGGVSAVGGITESAATGLDAAANYVTGGQLDAMALATASAKKMAMRKIDKLINMLPGKKSSAKPEASKPAKAGPAGDGAKVVGRSLLKKKVKCFCPNDHAQGGRDEYDRQLKKQNDGINGMSADDYLKERKAFTGKDACNGYKETPEGKTKERDPSVTKNAKNKRLKTQSEKYADEFFDKGKSRSDAKRLGSKKAQSELSKQDALHNQDMVAGGQDAIGALSADGSRSLGKADFGASDVNRHIGSQWNGERIQSIDAQACHAQKEGGGQEKMNVELRPCGKKEAKAQKCPQRKNDKE